MFSPDYANYDPRNHMVQEPINAIYQVWQQTAGKQYLVCEHADEEAAREVITSVTGWYGEELYVRMVDLDTGEEKNAGSYEYCEESNSYKESV